jgi:hypothetical protein
MTTDNLLYRMTLADRARYQRLMERVSIYTRTYRPGDLAFWSIPYTRERWTTVL